MSQSYTPKRGDIVWINFDPSTGIEIRKRRPALVVSVTALHQYGYAFVIPITSTSKDPALYPPLVGLRTEGQLIPFQLDSVDWEARQIEYIESAPESLVDDCIHILKMLMKIP